MISLQDGAISSLCPNLLQYKPLLQARALRNQEPAAGIVTCDYVAYYV